MPEARTLNIPSQLQKFLTSTTVEQMKTQVIEGNEVWLTTQALPDCDEHIRNVRGEFTGKAEINFYHAALIIKIRRKLDLDESLESFRALWNAEGLTLLKLLDSRWVISALDTFADYGEAKEQSLALMLTVFANMLKLADSEYVLSGRPVYEKPEVEAAVAGNIFLWDGIRMFHLPDDDTFANMIKRMRKQMAPIPLFGLILEVLLSKAAMHDTILSRLARHHMRHMW